MNRRNFIRTSAAAAAAVALPVNAMTKASGKGNFANPEVIEMLKRYHPMALSQRCAILASSAGLKSTQPTGRDVMSIPRELRVFDSDLIGSWVRNMSKGHNIYANFDEHSPNVMWSSGSKYIAIYYDLPKAGKFIFRAGTVDVKAYKAPTYASDLLLGWEDAPFLHWEGATVNAALEPENNMSKI